MQSKSHAGDVLMLSALIVCVVSEKHKEQEQNNNKKKRKLYSIRDAILLGENTSIYHVHFYRMVTENRVIGIVKYYRIIASQSDQSWLSSCISLLILVYHDSCIIQHEIFLRMTANLASDAVIVWTLK